MEIIRSILGIIGFGIGIPIGIFLGFIILIYCQSEHVKEPVIKPLHELDTDSLLDILREIPMWMKHPDYDRIDWLNNFISHLWPFLDKPICDSIRSTVEPMFDEYIGKFCINSIYFESLSIGTFPPHIHGIKMHQTNEKEVLIDVPTRWAGNPDITLVIQFFSLPITIQLLDVQVFLALRICLRPLVPTFPCFASTIVSLLEKPQVDFGLKLLGIDVMAIPGLYQIVQEFVSKQIAGLYLWPKNMDIQILDGSVGAIKKPIGILQVKIIRAIRLLKKDLLGTSDPYIKLKLSGERLPSKKTSIKKNNLNPEWNEDFKLIVKDPKSQALELHVFDWEKVGKHDKIGMQVVSLRDLVPYETKQLTLDLVKNTNPYDSHNRKWRGKLVFEITFNPFKEDGERLEGLSCYLKKGNGPETMSFHKGGLLIVNVERAKDVEGRGHNNNVYALVLFRGEKKKTKGISKTRDPIWNEEFQFVLEETPLKEKIHIEVMSKRRSLIGFQSKETLGHVDIKLIDVVYNGRINEKYHLINSRNGVIAVDVRWKAL
ncbi:synaptotagmin-3-like [Euphorbia lathyris]|uniref:synaptotagmin-3-like n=1 Tax=Euphorbia lathyris TaxID=212925 RepID=UPI003313B577